ncbi:DeoR/GlpR family DNA-binding transcription regulator [Treponema parvum]|uniref:DeoR/GlpR family DNA-binding transcription regulator n=1 Tax=Treponema parvum TaxID=138851 RepID=UPI001AEBDB47|nr:DeoR/GlpR family DNA-binding transcription regulator [Treponema parvum]
MSIRPKRIEEIKSYIYQNKTVTLEQLCREFKVSMSTLRRDLEEILQEKDIKKIYGGVTTTKRKELVPFDERNITNQEIKERIAIKAASLVENGDIIFIDSGTTTFHMIEALKEKKDITVITNNLEIIVQAVPYPDIKIISLSGMLSRKTLSFTGMMAAQVLQNYNIGKAFMAATGFSVENGITNSSPPETEIKQTAVQRSQQTYLLADSSKSGVISLMTYCSLDKIDALVTDAQPSNGICDFMNAHGVRIIIAE